MVMKAISGREASLLALLAQDGGLPKRDIERILGQLDGEARKIAEILVGRSTGGSKATRDAAEGLSDWAKGLIPVRS